MRLGLNISMIILSFLTVATSWSVSAQDIPNTAISIPSLPKIPGSIEYMVVDPVSNGKTYIYKAGMENQFSILLIHGVGDEGSLNWSHLIPELAERAPKMPLIIEENYTASLAEKLKRGELDVIVISLPFDEPGVLTMPLYREPFVLLIPSSHPLNQKPDFKIADLSTEDVLLLGAGHCFRDQVLKVCPDCKHHGAIDGIPFQTLEGGSLETIRYMVASGLGVTILPCSAAGAERFSERLLSIRRFDGDAPSRVVALAWRKSFPRPEAVDALRDAVLSCEMSCVNPLD